MFVVIEFTETNNCSVVPESWLFEKDGKLMCRWTPGNMSVATALKARKNMTPVIDAWPAYPARILRKESEYM